MLREYALIADGERGALIGPRGDISWLCLPQWHDDPAFSDLLGGPGRYAVAPADRYVWGGHYEPASLIWRSRWVTGGGIAESREALARPASPRDAVVLRRREGHTGTVRLDVELDVRSGGRRMRGLRRADDGSWTARSGLLHLRWSGAPDAQPDDDGVLHWSCTRAAGERHDLVLEVGLDAPAAPPDPHRLWSGTAAAWAEAVPDTSGTAAPRDAAQAYAVLRGLTSGSGGMVAAATLGLPERADRGRGYDYRYVWIRDQCYAGIAAAGYGPLPALTDAVAFSTARLLDDGPALKPAYRVDGGPVPDEHPLDLPGYPGGRPKSGNWVNQQFQLDTLGELLQLLAAAARHDVLDTDGWRAAVLAVDVIEEAWQRPDAGIWELTDDWWTQSRLAVVAGQRAIAQVAPTPHDAARAETLADAVLAETSRRCLHRDGWWQRSPTATGTDASLLLPPVRGALPVTDTRSRATLAAVLDQLTEDGYVYRFRPDATPLGEQEGAFLLCGFVLSLALYAAGDRVDAYRWFERTRAACGTPGLLAEEFDVAQRQLRGNLPQAFVHALLLECAQVLPR